MKSLLNLIFLMSIVFLLAACSTMDNQYYAYMEDIYEIL